MEKVCLRQMEALAIGVVLGAGYLLSQREKPGDPLKSNPGVLTSVGGGRSPAITPTSMGGGSTLETAFKSLPVKGANFTRARRSTERPEEGLYHTNMFPFFGSTIKQNIDPDANKQLLDYMVGAGSVDIGKRETQQMFNRERQDIGTPFGAPLQIEQHLEHIVLPTKRNNELPFEQIRSGPGLANGYTNIPSGGVQQAVGREAALRRYKTVNELRPGNQPKVTYEGVIMNPEAHIKTRGDVGEVEHRHPDKFYVNEGGERNLITTGQYLKGRVYPQPVDRAVNRPTTSTEYFGIQAPGDTTGTYVRAAHRDSHRTATQEFPMGPAVYSQAGGGNTGEITSDFGKDGYTALPNNRTITGTRTELGPAHGGAYVGTTPFMDDARFSKKMYFEGAPREFGNMQSTFPKGLPAKDSNDIARGTIREQMEDNEWLGLAAPSHGVHSTRLRTDFDAADTMTTREQTGETNWVAPANAEVSWERDQTAERNMRQNRNKERIARGRTPTKQREKIASGKQAVHIKTRKVETDYFNQYERAPTDLKRVTTNRSVLGKTQIRPKQGVGVHLERTDPGFLSPLASNPYVISVAGPPGKIDQKL